MSSAGLYQNNVLQTWTNMSCHIDKSILFLDDVDSLKDLISTFFLQQGYRTLTAVNRINALALYRATHSDTVLVILDLIMPGISGIQCLKKLLEINPNLKVINKSWDTEVLGCRQTSTSDIPAVFPKAFGRR